MKPTWWPQVESEADQILSAFTEKLRTKLSVAPEKLVGRKNPFLFRARVESDAREFARMVTDAYLSSSEETMFGDVLEGIAVSICKNAKGGWKSTADKIDLEYDRGGVRCIAQVKSGVNWGNSSQRQAMVRSFQKASRILRQGSANLHVECIEGVCYGKSRIKDYGSHRQFVGRCFWKEISDWDGTAPAIFELIGTHASNGLNQARAEARERVVEYLLEAGAAQRVETSPEQIGQSQLECPMRWERLLSLVLE